MSIRLYLNSTLNAGTLRGTPMAVKKITVLDERAEEDNTASIQKTKLIFKFLRNSIPCKKSLMCVLTFNPTRPPNKLWFGPAAFAGLGLPTDARSTVSRHLSKRKFEKSVSWMPLVVRFSNGRSCSIMLAFYLIL